MALCRVRILADLHWKLARPLTGAEQRLQDITLPGLEAAVAKLQHSLEVSPTLNAINTCSWRERLNGVSALCRALRGRDFGLSRAQRGMCIVLQVSWILMG